MTTTIEPAEGTPLACQCALPLSRQTLTFVAGLLRAHLKKIGSRWRKLPPGKIALIVLATLRHDHRLAGMAGGNGVSASTISRWTWEIIGLLAARAPRLDRALAAITRQGGDAVLLDGTLISTCLDPDPEDPVIITGCKATRTRKTTPAQRQANQALSAARAPVEHGFSDLKNWRSLTRLRINPSKATALLRALLVLTRQHTTR